MCVFFVELFLASLDSGRGFLPSSRQEFGLRATEQIDGTWTIERVEIAPSMRVAPSSPDTRWYYVIEHSMGRYNPPLNALAWRCSSWRVSLATLDPVTHELDVEDWLGEADPLISELDEFLARSVIPRSEAMRFWPDMPPEPVRRTQLSWVVWQNRICYGNIATALVFFTVVAACISAVIPVKRKESVNPHISDVPPSFEARRE